MARPMMVRGKRAYPEVYALLWLTRQCESEIIDYLISRGIPARSIQRGLHLTVYYARRILPGLARNLLSRTVAIEADVTETRFMVLAPGGENPRPELNPAKRSVGLRLTRRNSAITEIQALRREMYKLETRKVVGRRKPSTDWTSCFGSRHYQPHIKLLRPGSEIDRDLTEIGESFRQHFNVLEFGKYGVVLRPRRRADDRGSEETSRFSRRISHPA